VFRTVLESLVPPVGDGRTVPDDHVEEGVQDQNAILRQAGRREEYREGWFYDREIDDYGKERERENERKRTKNHSR
jgi:hypothetical protein